VSIESPSKTTVKM